MAIPADSAKAREERAALVKKLAFMVDPRCNMVEELGVVS
jgi:hypothetical protein